MRKRSLNNRQQLFCLEYIKDFNGARAARDAGYSHKQANVKANDLLKLSYVQSYLSDLVEKRMRRAEIAAGDVLERHIVIDQLDLIDIFNSNFTLKPIEEWPLEWRMVVDSIKVRQVVEREGKKVVERAEVTEIKLPSKLKNLELLGKHVSVGAYGEKKKEESPAFLTLKSILDDLDGKTCGLPGREGEVYS